MRDTSENGDDNEDHRIGEIGKRGARRIRDHVQEPIPLLRAEAARMVITDIDDQAAQVETVVLLIDLLLEAREYAAAVIERVENYRENQHLADLEDERCDGDGTLWEEPMDPRDVENAFQQLLAAHGTAKRGTPGRKPHKISRVYQVVHGRENEAIPLEDFATPLKGVPNPRLRASRDISETNQAFRAQAIPLELRGTSYGHDQERTTVYRLRWVPQR